MKKYNNIPFKERKRLSEYSFNHQERLEELLIRKEIKRMEKEKCEEYTSEKDREAQEVVYEKLKELERRQGNNGKS